VCEVKLQTLGGVNIAAAFIRSIVLWLFFSRATFANARAQTANSTSIAVSDVTYLRSPPLRHQQKRIEENASLSLYRLIRQLKKCVRRRQTAYGRLLQRPRLSVLDLLFFRHQNVLRVAHPEQQPADGRGRRERPVLDRQPRVHFSLPAFGTDSGGFGEFVLLEPKARSDCVKNFLFCYVKTL